jgi:SPP1 gp7 family putative phage head morphogenesis protein
MPPIRSPLSSLVSAVTAKFRRTTGSAIPSGSAPNRQPGSGWNAGPGNSPDITQFSNVFQPSGGLFAPGFPLVPIERERLRQWDFPVGYNYIYTPRSFEPISFRELRALAQEPITRLYIETRKDQIEALDWVIKPINERKPKPGADDRSQDLIKFFLKPDGYHPFATWLRLLIEDVLVTDAAALEVRRNRRGDIIALDYVDGATFKILIDDIGRRPLPPAPAYEQVIHGRPWVLAEEGRVDTNDRGTPLFDAQILYMPRNPRGARAYGHSPVEQILLTINTALRRETMQLQHFTTSNVPAGMVASPDGWSSDQIKQYQDWFDSVLSGNLGDRTKVIWGPANTSYQLFKEPPFKDDFDEWLARIVSFAFSLPPTWAVHQLNRATAEQAQEVALEEGLAPLLGWVKRLIDTVVQDRLGHPDLEFAWSDKRPVDPLEQQQILAEYVHNGIMTRNEGRDILGLDRIPGGDDATVEVAGQGVRLVRHLKNRNLAVKVSDTVLTKRGNPVNSPARALAAAKLRRVIEEFFIAEAPLAAAEILRAIDKANNDINDNDDANPVGQDKDQHWLEALIIAVLLAIDFSRWRVLIVPIAAILTDLGADIFADATNGVGAADIAADGKGWAEDFAKQRAAELVDPNAEMSIARSTCDMLRPVIERAFKENMDLAELTAALRQSTAFSRDRVERIADFEATNTYHQAVLRAFMDSGKVKQVQWVTMHDDRVEAVCQQNEDAGPIALGQDFPSGHQAPPAHVACRCWLQPVLGEV